MAVATLALAIGANTAIFTIADAVLFRPLSFADPSRVHVVTVRDRRSGTLLPSVPIEYVMAIDAHHRGLGRIALRGPTLMMTHSGAAEAEWMETFAVSPEYFEVLGVRPARGRLFDRGDITDPGRAAILTFDSWQTRFGGDEAIIGRAVKLGARERDIIGVLPRGFAFPATSLHFQYRLTGKPAFVTTAPAERADPNDDMAPLVIGGAATNPVVRLEPGVSRDQAQAELDALVAPIRASRASGPDELVGLSDPRAVLFPTGRPIMAWLVAAAGLVLLIASANLAAMLLARTRRRDREIGLHLALGATRARILWPIFFETLIIGAAAALLAFIVTLSTFDVLLRQVPPAAYGVASVQVDARVAVFALVLGVAGGLIFAVIPAWWSVTLDVRLLVTGRPRHTPPRRRVVGHPLITAQVMLAIVLVFGAVVAGCAFVSVLRLPLGISADNVVALNAGANPDKSRTLRAYYLQAIAVLAARGDVVAASAGGSVPPDGYRAVEVIESAGRPAAGVVHVLPGYFEVLGIPLIRGRLFTPRDVTSADTAVLSQSAARALFSNRDALGATFRDRAGRPFTVIGITGDVRRSLSQNLDPPAYIIPPDSTTRGLTIVARMRDRQANTIADLRRELAPLAPEIPVTGVWWSDSISALTPYRTPRFQSLVLGTFAVLALGLTALGIFAAVASFVAARTRELGVRLALGASPQLLIRSTVGQALVPVLSGMVLGVIATEWLRRIAATQLIELDIVRHGGLTMGVTVAVVTAAAVVAAYFPARYASRIDPAVVLRAE